MQTVSGRLRQGRHVLQHLIGDAVAFASLLKGLRKFMSSVVKVRILYGVQVSERQLAAFIFPYSGKTSSRKKTYA